MATRVVDRRRLFVVSLSNLLTWFPVAPDRSLASHSTQPDYADWGATKNFREAIGLTDTSAPGHFGTKTLRHRCRSVRDTSAPSPRNVRLCCSVYTSRCNVVFSGLISSYMHVAYTHVYMHFITIIEQQPFRPRLRVRHRTCNDTF